MSNLHLQIFFSDHATECFQQKLVKIKSHQGDVYVWNDGHPWITHPKGIEMLRLIRGATTSNLYLVLSGNCGMPNYYLGFKIIECSYIVCFMKKHKIFNQKYCNETKNQKGTFLFLTGKPRGYHRTGLLYKIWKNNLLQNCRYSFFGNTDEFKKESEKYIDNDDQKLFFETVKNQSPDQIEVQRTGPMSVHYLGIPYDMSLYEQTQFSVVSETYDWKGPPYHITEKTWRAILNCHPFILAGQPGMISYLESIGFNCYRTFLTKDYDESSTIWGPRHNDDVIENIKHWLYMNKQEWNEIIHVAHKNQKILFKYFEENKKINEEILAKIEDPEFHEKMINFF
jgi:hypothetical protein